jgi:hypothetical protein
MASMAWRKKIMDGGEAIENGNNNGVIINNQ